MLIITGWLPEGPNHAHLEGSWELGASLFSEQTVPEHQQVLWYFYQDLNTWVLPFHTQIYFAQFKPQLETVHFTDQ